MSLVSLGEYLILLVCLELPLLDVLSLRQVCRVLSEATRAKILWIHILERAVQDEGQILPPYLKRHDLLDTVTLEALVRRMSKLTHKWETGDLSPVKSWRLYLPQSITWLRLVAGTWLFVASSDNHSSKISCWDLSMVSQGVVEPLAEAYLPGQVKTGKLEVQDSGIVLALGLGAESLSVHIITLRRRSGCHFFCELARIEGSSHVLMLRGNLVGCAVRHAAIVPHIINWEDNRIVNIPSGPDIPGRRSVPHLMTIWTDLLVILRTNALEFYTLPSAAGDSVFVKVIQTPTIWEAVVCNSASTASVHPIAPLRLMNISTLGIEMFVIERDLLAAMDTCHIVCLAKAPQCMWHEDPWYRLCIGDSGRRSLWMSASEDIVGTDPYFINMDVPLLSSDTEILRIPWRNTDEPEQPAPWALPVVDFDDALGLTVIGNCFGELAIYDHGGKHPECSRGFAADFTDQPTPIPPLLPTTPISLGLSVTPRPPATGAELDPSMVSQWSKDNLPLHEMWSTDWSFGYYDWELWQGAPYDIVWTLEHAYGFPGPVIPQAHATDGMGYQFILCRSGNRYLVYTRDSDKHLRSWPLNPSDRDFHITATGAQLESFIRRTALTEGSTYTTKLSYEVGDLKRNRWTEQAERGGKPHKNLLINRPW
ncbi:hypothetical protein C8R44DRAFT_978415 [Mycena epipterygia]|nr:hypothetical protein C8R44DRAFT_978415 [Mycena epipterygia]